MARAKDAAMNTVKAADVMEKVTDSADAITTAAAAVTRTDADLSLRYKKMMKTAVVILNWNTKGYLEQFVPGILKSLEGEDAGLVVADSASTDGSMQMMEEKFPSVRRIQLDRNYGFTGGYNMALGQIDAEYFVLLNSDIEVPEGWLRPLVETLDNHPEAGACAPKLHSWFEKDKFEYAGAAGGYLDSFGFPFCRGRIMKMVEKDWGQYDTPEDVFWATGACLMVRRSLFESLGGLDGRFFAHMEEIDLCWRIQLAGYRVRIVPESAVYHIGGGTLPQTSPWKLKLNYRNNLLLLENNLARTYALDILRSRMGDEPERMVREIIADGAATGKMAAKACRRAGRRIFWRMAVDGCTGLAYLAMLKWCMFKAVVQAHGEFRKLSARPSPDDVAGYITGILRSAEVRDGGRGADAVPEIRGMYGHWILPRAVLMREKAFDAIRKYFSGKH